MPVQAYDLSRLSVLIVEKHLPMRTLIRQVLHEFGVQNVFDAPTPEAGFEAFNDVRPDMVLVDWAPDFDGLALLRNIRTDEASNGHETPVIMVTAFNEMTHVYEALDAGMTEYLAKPVSARLLYLRIVSVIENRRRFLRTKGFTGPDRRRHSSCVYGGEERRQEDPDRNGPPDGDRNGHSGESRVNAA